jgi:hypothetical protein
VSQVTERAAVLTLTVCACVCVCACVLCLRYDNIINMDLDMPESTTQSYMGPDMVSNVSQVSAPAPQSSLHPLPGTCVPGEPCYTASVWCGLGALMGLMLCVCACVCVQVLGMPLDAEGEEVSQAGEGAVASPYMHYTPDDAEVCVSVCVCVCVCVGVPRMHDTPDDDRIS